MIVTTHSDGQLLLQWHGEWVLKMEKLLSPTRKLGQICVMDGNDNATSIHRLILLAVWTSNDKLRLICWSIHFRQPLCQHPCCNVRAAQTLRMFKWEMEKLIIERVMPMTMKLKVFMISKVITFPDEANDMYTGRKILSNSNEACQFWIYLSFSHPV